MIKPVLIAGPTASGKSEFALRIAEEFGGVIINADSAQVYQELEIISARPGAADCARAPHRLYGHVTGAIAYSTGAWLEDIAAVLADLSARGERAIIVGGTGLYFHALLQGLSEIPDIPADVRAHWRAEAARLGGPGLHKVLLDKDPVMGAILNPNDRQRVCRALEVFEATGRSLKSFQDETGPPFMQLEDTIPFVMSLDRAVLYEQINRRFAWMVEQGGVDEVKALLDLKLDPGLPIMRALGVPELASYIGGEISLEGAALAASQNTRRFAKRQLTWLRRNMIAWNQVFSKEMERELAKIFAIIYKNG